MQRRKLFMTTPRRANAAGPRLPAIQERYERAPGRKELIVLDGSAHAQFIFATGASERLMHDIPRFLCAAAKTTSGVVFERRQ